MPIFNIPNNTQLKHALLEHYMSIAETNNNGQYNIEDWFDIYNSFNVELSDQLRVAILKQILITSCNTSVFSHSYKYIQIKKIINEFELNNEKGATELIDSILSMKDSHATGAIKLTAMLLFSNTTELINSSSLLTKPTIPKIKLSIPISMWGDIWPKLVNIKNETQRINIIATCMYSNMIFDSTKSSIESGVFNTLNNVLTTNLNLDQKSIDRVWSVLVSKCTRQDFIPTVCEKLYKLSNSTNEVSIDQHLDALIRTHAINIYSQISYIIKKHRNGTLSNEIKEIFKTCINKDALGSPTSIASLNNNRYAHVNELRNWAYILELFPDKKDLIRSMFKEESTNVGTQHSDLTTIINIISSDTNDISNILSKLLDNEKVNLTTEEITYVESAFIKKLESKKYLNNDFLDKLNILESVCPEIIKRLTNNTYILNKLILLLYKEYTKPAKEQYQQIQYCSRRLLSGIDKPMLISPSNIEFKLVEFFAPTKLESLYKAWSTQLNIQKSTPIEYTHSQDEFFFQWLQTELLNQKPILIKDLSNLAESLNVKPDSLIESWKLSTPVEHAKLPSFD